MSGSSISLRFYAATVCKALRTDWGYGFAQTLYVVPASLPERELLYRHHASIHGDAANRVLALASCSVNRARELLDSKLGTPYQEGQWSDYRINLVCGEQVRITLLWHIECCSPVL